MFYERGALKNFNLQGNTCARFSFPSKEVPAQGFSTELCEFFKNTCFAEPLRMGASVFISLST